MLPITHVVWRHLLAETREERRTWPSLRAIAEDLDLGVSTVHKALARPSEIGAVHISRLGGVEVWDPLRLLTLFTAHRQLQRDVIARRHVVAAPPEWAERAARDAGLTVGGFGAIVSHLGSNPIASYATVILYGDARFGRELVPAQEAQPSLELVICTPDRWLERYGDTTPFAQAYADVFCLPTWQASRFIEELDPWTVASRDERNLVA